MYGLFVRMQKYLCTWSSAMTGSVLMDTSTNTAIANTVATTAEGTISYTHRTSVSTSTKHDTDNSIVANNDITPVAKLQRVDQTASIKPVVESLGHGSNSSMFDF